MGSTVNAVYSENKEKRSDVLTVARFLHHVLENKRSWVLKGIDKLLKGKSGLATPDGMDIFAGRFEALRETGHDGLAVRDQEPAVVADRAFVGLDPVADAADPAGHVVPGAFEAVPEAVDDACACVDEDAAGVGEETANGARQASEPADHAVPRVPGTVRGRAEDADDGGAAAAGAGQERGPPEKSPSGCRGPRRYSPRKPE